MLAKSGIRQVVRWRAAAAGMDEPGLHAFRRAFAVNCLRNDMDLVSLQRLLGLLHYVLCRRIRLRIIER